MEDLVSEKGMRVFEGFFGRARGRGLMVTMVMMVVMMVVRMGTGMGGRRVWRVWTYLLHVCAEIEVIPRKAIPNPQMPD
jgi:hypothetical protein